MLKGCITLVLMLMAMLTGSCGHDRQIVTVAIPDDAPDKTRALLMLQQLGYLRLKPNTGQSVSCDDIDDNPCGIQFREVPPQHLPDALKKVDFAMMPSGVAMSAGLKVRQSAVAVGGLSESGHVIAVQENMESSPEVKVFVAAVRSKAVSEFIEKTYGGNVVSVVKRPDDGYDSTVDYKALEGRSIPVAALAFPHAEILADVSNFLENNKITLDVHIYETTADANAAVANGDVVANYCQHFQNLQEFNQSKGVRLVSCGEVHTEPMGLYPGHAKSLSSLNR